MFDFGSEGEDENEIEAEELVEKFANGVECYECGERFPEADIVAWGNVDMCKPCYAERERHDEESDSCEECGGCFECGVCVCEKCTSCGGTEKPFGRVNETVVLCRSCVVKSTESGSASGASSPR